MSECVTLPKKNGADQRKSEVLAKSTNDNGELRFFQSQPKFQTAGKSIANKGRHEKAKGIEARDALPLSPSLSRLSRLSTVGPTCHAPREQQSSENESRREEKNEREKARRERARESSTQSRVLALPQTPQRTGLPRTRSALSRNKKFSILTDITR